MAKPKILVADPISEIGIEELKADPRLEVDVRIGIKPDEDQRDAAALPFDQRIGRKRCRKRHQRHILRGNPGSGTQAGG